MSDRCWKEFWLSGTDGIFHLKATASGIDGNKLISGESQTIPYISRSDSMNGVKSFVSSKQKQKYKIDSGNCITIGLDTQTVFYQPHSFFTGQNIQVLRNKELSQELALFLVETIRKQMVKFNWGGNGATLGRLARLKIMLPVDKNGEPDFDYMESTIYELKKAKTIEYREFLKKELKSIRYVEIPKLDEKEWDAFKLTDVFKINPGKRLTVSDMKMGNTPFIGASDSNNGITNFISNRNASFDRNVLGVNYNGSVVENFYHPYDCLFSDDVKRFHLKNWKDGKFILLFMKGIILQQKSKFLYAYKFNEKRMKNQSIMLPVDGNGAPDYSYMEQYIKNIFYTKAKEYLDFKAR
ncbi:restriction endonuclease subunit S [uncultured Fibrobacter sp.]|uniref:restriction endonuclease subunit S n=1 Tax=uncultured Fibrobacter sp. TaxID=261512 RepID=UPI0025E29F6A|nr:restriction endonuclease subunit S [uncultured Fibrobacter sp.]